MKNYVIQELVKIEILDFNIYIGIVVIKLFMNCSFFEILLNPHDIFNLFIFKIQSESSSASIYTNDVGVNVINTGIYSCGFEWLSFSIKLYDFKFNFSLY